MKFVLLSGGKQRVADVQGEAGRWSVSLDGTPQEVDVLETDQGGLSLIVAGQTYACDFDRKGDKVRVHVRESVFEFEVLDERRARRQLAAGGLVEGGAQVVVAPMPGKVVRVLIKVGQAVKAGDGLIVVEAMKMENELRAVRDGVVKEVAVQEGVPVEGGAKLCVVE